MRPATGPRGKRQGLSFEVFEAEPLSLHTQAQSCEHRVEICPSMHTAHARKQTRHLKPQRTRRSVDTEKTSHTRRPTHTQVHTEKTGAHRTNENTRSTRILAPQIVRAYLISHFGSQRQGGGCQGALDPVSHRGGTHRHSSTGGGALPLRREGVQRHQAEKALWLKGKVSKHLPRGLGPGLAPKGFALGVASPAPTSGSPGESESWAPGS